MEPLLGGILTGLSIAAPLGPNGALCIRRSLAAGRRAGFVTGLGAATAHAIFVAIAITGMGVSTALVGRADLVQCVAGLVLVGLGLRTLRLDWALSVDPAAPSDATTVRAYLSTLTLALANPLTIAALSALLGGLGTPTRGALATALVIAGVFTGSAAWWLALSTAVAAVRTRIRARHLMWANRGTGASLAAFGVWVVLTSM
ncbi:MAG: LysE family translocator [Actinomycetota bacterium]|nr:LysE family translocator [Actinomycetota bacterium]